MSEPHFEEHSSWIKTPTQLIIVVVAAFVVTVLVIVMLVQLVVDKRDFGPANPGMSEEAVAKRLKPVGEIVVSDPNAPKVEKSGKAVYDTVCAACHSTGVLNAPKLGDKTAWAKLIKEGLETITQNAIKGIRQMPARGGNPELTDTEVVRAAVYMANQAGADWKEPELKPAAAPVAAAAPAAASPAPAAAAAAPAAASGKGKSVYDSACMVCHAAGVAGAPKAGDKAQWAPRLKAGVDLLYTSALKGKNAMPPKGGQTQLPDADVKAAVDYMVGLVK